MINNNKTYNIVGTTSSFPTNNSNFNTNDPLSSLYNNPNFLSIVTHNIRNCSSDTKLQQIESFFTNLNFDIMGLSETHLTYNQVRHLNNNYHDKPYKFFFHNANREHNCQGVGLIIKNELCKHI